MTGTEEKQITVADIRDAVRQMESDPDESSPAFGVAVVLLSSAVVGTGIRALTKFTGMPQEEVSRIVRSAAAHRIFVGRRVHANWLEDGGGLDLMLDVLTVQGILCREWR